MNAQHASSALSNRVPFTCFFTSGNKKKLQEERSGKIWWVWQLLYLTLTEKERAVAAVCCDQHVMSCHVMMKKKAMESPLWVVLVPNFKEFPETVVHIPFCTDCLSVLKRIGDDMQQPFSSVSCVAF